MMGCNDDGCEFNSVITADSFNGIKLRPLIPKQPPPFNHHCIKPTDFFALNHNLASATTGDQNKGEQNMSSQQPPVVVSSRWNPTPEQLQSLEELYRRGTRTPSADQIQNITAQLRRYGRVEGKNVFYWFQNHKARERQKRRRQIEPNPDHKPSPFNQNFARKDSGRTEDQVEQVKNWTTTTNCTNLAEEPVSVAMPTKAVMAEGRADNRCVQFNEGELQNRRNFMRRNATWQMMQMSPNQYPLMLNSTVFNKITPMDFIKNNGDLYKRTHEEEEEDWSKGESQTLQLFPLRSEEDEEEEDGNDTDTLMSVTEAMKASNFITPTYQFYEFLPLKN